MKRTQVRNKVTSIFFSTKPLMLALPLPSHTLFVDYLCFFLVTIHISLWASMAACMIM